MRLQARSIAVLVTLITMAFGFAAADAGAAKAPTAKSSLKSLVRQVNSLPPYVASATKRRALKRLAGHARRSARRRPCASVKDLNRFRRIVASVPVRSKGVSRKRRRAAKRLSALSPASVTASRLLLASKRTKRCGGGVRPPKGDNPKVRILRSDARRLRVRVELPAVQFVPREADGKAWTQLVLPNSDSPGVPGTPGIPVVSDVLAVPDGAKMKVSVNDVDKILVDGVDVFPVQPDPVDQDTAPPNFLKGPFVDRPFELNEKAYAKNGVVPAKPADADSLGTVRDLNVGGLQIPTAQYNAKSKKLVLLKSVDVTVGFAGGPHTFSEELGNPWEQFQRGLAETFLNARLLGRIDLREIYRRCGEEMMVITNPATLAAANTFAAARNAAGIRTTVFQTGAAPGQIGTTAAAIQTFIRERSSQLLCIRPSYVTIMGDDDLVPTFPGINGIPSDLQYSMKTDSDELPDLAVGRIIGNDQAAVGTAVDKIISYENSPPTGPWRRRATIAAQFQDDDNNGQENRTFITFAETLRTGLVNTGNTVDRVYDDSPTATPLKFNDGTDLPAELKKPTFAWDGDGADVSAAWNEGRFLMVHRDHGWSDGWGHPGFGTADVQALTNGNLLPVMMSINCSSGAYDYDETSFVGEALVKANGGVVGAFGDTRDSPTWHNTQIGLGFADALLPAVLPAEGPAARQRVGNALIHGKMRLAGMAPPSGPGITGGDGSTRNELYLWHYFGDPTMQMWGGRREFVLDPSLFNAVFELAVQQPPPGDPPPYWVIVNVPTGLNGETLSILQNGNVVGKAVVTGDTVRIPASLSDGSKPVGQLQVAVDGEGAPPILIDVKNEPPAATSISGDCSGGAGTNDPMFMSGTLSGAPAGSTVTVTYEHPSSGTVERVSDTTDAQGNYQTSFVGDRAGDWFITARYAGTDQYQASATAPCNINSG
jgi:Peptidase family C25/Propeptide_C25